MEQWGDWTKEVRVNLEEFGIPCNLGYIKSMSESKFRNLVKITAKEYALRELQEQQGTHSKMGNLYYSDLQEYLKIPGTQTKETLHIFNI